jgi:hypothetical protein
MLCRRLLSGGSRLMNRQYVRSLRGKCLVVTASHASAYSHTRTPWFAGFRPQQIGIYDRDD